MLKRAFPYWTRRGVVVRRLTGRPLGDRLHRVWRRFVATHPTVRFVQIGAHNGSDNDLLVAPAIARNPGWAGILVEPIPELFAELQARYSDTGRFTPVEAAVTDHDGTVQMITAVGAHDVASWADLLSSIHRNVILKHEDALPGLGEAVHNITVPAMTFASLTKTLNRIDLLVIDTEGHDAVILDQVNLVQWHPAAVLYEHEHLTDNDRARCEARLAASGYELTSDAHNTLALRGRKR